MIVFDSSTLILLAKAELLETFIYAFPGKVMIPEKVKSEVFRSDGEEVPIISRLIKERKIMVVNVKKQRQIKKLMTDFNIDIGEAEAIILALEKRCNIVATDDRNAIRTCKILKLRFITAISILVRIFEKGLIARDEARATLYRLASAGRYAEKIINNAAERLKGGV